MARRLPQPYRLSEVDDDSSGGVHAEVDDLETWLEEGYARSYRTACLILGNRSDAEEAVQEAFLRAWRFRASLATGSDVRPWLYRVVVNTCNSKLRQEIPRRDRLSSEAELDSLSSAENSPSQVALSQDLVRLTGEIHLARYPSSLALTRGTFGQASGLIDGSVPHQSG
jgi:DNA-directed RNA polymerase specialized sigma24 family protein